MVWSLKRVAKKEEKILLTILSQELATKKKMLTQRRIDKWIWFVIICMKYNARLSHWKAAQFTGFIS